MTWPDLSYYEVLQVIFAGLAVYAGYAGDQVLVAVSLVFVLLVELRLLRADVREA